MEKTVEIQALPTTLASTVQAHVDSLPTVNPGLPEIAALGFFPHDPKDSPPTNPLAIYPRPDSNYLS